MSNYKILKITPSSDYELIDSGDGEKLERFGEYVLSRPDPQALWPKRLPREDWDRCDAYFTRDSDRAEWTINNKSLPDSWFIDFGGLRFKIKPSSFKHVGLFPEQSSNWEWIREKLKGRTGGLDILNLFGYTGGASLICAQAGANVVHIDSSKSAVTWARENAEISELKDAPIRWIVEDARLFVEREIKRGNKYDGIIMDPPAFGHGPAKELWKIEDHFLPLLENCKKLLKDEPTFFLINGYSAGYSAMAYQNNLIDLVDKFGGETEVGELMIVEKYKMARLLPAGIFARWSKD